MKQRTHKPLPKNAYEQKRLLLWIADQSKALEDGTREQKRLVRDLGVPTNPKSFYDTDDPTHAQYVAHSKQLASLERRGFITRSAEQYKPHVKLTRIGHREVRRLRVEETEVEQQRREDLESEQLRLQELQEIHREIFVERSLEVGRAFKVLAAAREEADALRRYAEIVRGHASKSLDEALRYLGYKISRGEELRRELMRRTLHGAPPTKAHGLYDHYNCKTYTDRQLVSEFRTWLNYAEEEADHVHHIALLVLERVAQLRGLFDGSW